MGNNFCCVCHREKLIISGINEGEDFIREVFNYTKLHKFTINEIHRLLVNKELTEIDEIKEVNYYIEVSYYSSMVIENFYEKNSKINKFNQIHSILFSFIASSFQHSITQLNGLKLLRALLVFTKSTLEEKVKYFYLFSKPKITLNRIEETLKIIITEFMKFLLRDITYEMSILLFNEGRNYMDNLNSMNSLCKTCSDENLDKFVSENIFHNYNLSSLSNSNSDGIQNEVISFLLTKPFLFDYGQLRDLYFSQFLK